MQRRDRRTVFPLSQIFQNAVTNSEGFRAIRGEPGAALFAGVSAPRRAMQKSTPRKQIKRFEVLPARVNIKRVRRPERINPARFYQNLAGLVSTSLEPLN